MRKSSDHIFFPKINGIYLLNKQIKIINFSKFGKEIIYKFIRKVVSLNKLF